MTMNPAIDHLLQKLFRVNNLEEAAAADIEQLAGRYPYYAPLQYLLANKYRQADPPQYRLQITKTAVFFSNPHWLNDLLLSDEDDPVSTGGAIPEAAPQSADSTEKEEILTVRDLAGPDEPALSEAVQPELVQDVSSEAEHIMPPEHAVQNTPPGWALPEEKAEADNAAADLPEMLPPEASHIPDATEDHEVLSPAETSSVAETTVAEPQEDISGEVTGSFAANTGGEGPNQQEEAFQNVSGFSEQPGDSNTAPDEPMVKKESAPQQGEDLPVTDPPGMITGKKPLQQLSDTGNNNLPAIPFEPLYTVDYFASQGIQLTNEEGSDKLSRKLRSFTEWLKTMKRIHPEKLEQEMDSGKAAAIQHIAEHSNELEDVVTEAMAEVYARQGLRAKAAEVYQKLSLLNPNKRTYFAARISKLNDI